MSDPDPAKLSDVLTDEQEVTLRRVAFGESPARTLRAADLKQLRALRLIENGKDGPVLTPEGKRRYDGLSRAIGTQPGPQPDDLLGALDKALRGYRR
jgi:hypothetical protein